MPEAARQSKVQLVFGVFFLVLGSIGAIGGVGAYLRDSKIAKTGVHTEARILHKDVIHDAEEGNEFSVDYRFDLPDGTQIKSTAYLPKDEWSRLSVGATLPVVYAAEYPRRSFPEGGGVTSPGIVILATLLFGALAVMGAALTIGYFRQSTGDG